MTNMYTISGYKVAFPSGKRPFGPQLAVMNKVHAFAFRLCTWYIHAAALRLSGPPRPPPRQ